MGLMNLAGMSGMSESLKSHYLILNTLIQSVYRVLALCYPHPASYQRTKICILKGVWKATG